jgi:hypothetical protein
MAREFPESDWKIFRELSEVALDRFCKRIPDELEQICRDKRRTNHERYLAVWKLIQKRDKEVGQMFNDLRRSRMLWQLEDIYANDLFGADEIKQFSEETRRIIGFLDREK